jgi:Xaa-Pro aminopeptidase
MPFALEPKFIYAGERAVGMENTYVAQGGGTGCLTPAITALIEV